VVARALFLFKTCIRVHHAETSLPWYQIQHPTRRRANVVRAGRKVALVYSTYFDVARRFLFRMHDQHSIRGRAPVDDLKPACRSATRPVRVPGASLPDPTRESVHRSVASTEAKPSMQQHVRRKITAPRLAAMRCERRPCAERIVGAECRSRGRRNEREEWLHTSVESRTRTPAVSVACDRFAISR